MARENRSEKEVSSDFCWQLDRESPVPLYLQIRQQLMVMISGWTDMQQRFPSDEELARQFEVTKATIRQAMGDLTRAGLLTRQRGAGTFVVPPMVERLAPSVEIEKNYKLAGGSLSYKIHALNERPATAAEARTLQLDPGAPVVWLRRVRSMAHVPVAIDDRVMSRSMADLLNFDSAAATNSIIDLVQSRLKLTRAVWELNARLAGPEDSALLQIPPTDPILSRSLVYYQEDGKAILMGDTHHRSDLLRCGFEMDLSGADTGPEVHSWTGEALLAQPDPEISA
jgi:GntR family transcriptional regulator